MKYLSVFTIVFALLASSFVMAPANNDKGIKSLVTHVRNQFNREKKRGC